MSKRLYIGWQRESTPGTLPPDGWIDWWARDRHGAEVQREQAWLIVMTERMCAIFGTTPDQLTSAQLDSIALLLYDISNDDDNDDD